MRQIATLFLTAGMLAGSAARAELLPLVLEDTATRIALSASLPPEAGALVLEGFQGHEAMSSLYSFQLDLVSSNGTTIAMDSLLGKTMGVTVTTAGGRTRHFQGICSRITQGQRDGTIRYRAEMVPSLWLLTRRQSSRVFQDMSVPDIVSEILGQVPGLAFESRLQGTFHPRNYVVQYRETDFDFVSRLMEEDGIFYFFLHDEGGHTMVLGNSPQGHPDLPGVFPYLGGRLLPGRPDSIQGWEKTQEIRAGKVTLRDHTFELPSNDLEFGATIQDTVAAGGVTHRLSAGGGDALELYDYPGGYAQRFDGVDPGGGERPTEIQKIFDDGPRTAGIRMQEEAADALSIQGRSTSAVFSPGHRFQLARHFDGDGSYVLTSVQHSARAAVYQNSFQCIPAGLPFRPRRATPKPVIPGPQTAVVVGPPGEEIFTDKYGRVKVQFHWDRQGQNDAHSSCWIRVSTPHAGTEPGSYLVPEVGDEVIVAFLEGDPDQPIILGSVYNAHRLPPPPALIGP
ncbi:MAG: type VI secretion system Vgr family protein [Candidatus Polarisedimenticolia bacterium]